MSYSVTATTDGASDGVALPVGDYALQIVATAWDGASATLQSSVDGVGYADANDPDTGEIFTATANSKVVRAIGGAFYRLNVSSYGASTAGLKLIANPATK